jgi:hypothetical protein
MPFTVSDVRFLFVASAQLKISTFSITKKIGIQGEVDYPFLKMLFHYCYNRMQPIKLSGCCSIAQ